MGNNCVGEGGGNAGLNREGHGDTTGDGHDGDEGGNADGRACNSTGTHVLHMLVKMRRLVSTETVRMAVLLLALM